MWVQFCFWAMHESLGDDGKYVYVRTYAIVPSRGEIVPTMWENKRVGC